jgi:hypothetical protein
MRRREFITLIGGAAGWPLAAQAKLPTMGTISPSAEGLRLVALVQRLRELGWIEDRNVAIAVRWAEGRPERYSEIAAEFIRLKVDVVVTGGTQSVLALKQATSIIPIVFATVADPVGIGLVASLARPGGNLTGVNFFSAELVAKRLDTLHELVPKAARVAVFHQPVRCSTRRGPADRRAGGCPRDRVGTPNPQSRDQPRNRKRSGSVCHQGYFWSCILLHCMSLRFGETGKHFGRSEVFSVCRDSSRRNAVHGGNFSLGSTL